MAEAMAGCVLPDQRLRLQQMDCYPPLYMLHRRNPLHRGILSYVSKLSAVTTTVC